MRKYLMHGVGLFLFLLCCFSIMAVFAEDAVVTPTGLDIFGTAGILAVVIPVIVNFLKKIPVIGDTWAPAVAFILGALFGIAAFYLKMTASLTLWQAILAGIAVGGTSTGLYDLQKQVNLKIIRPMFHHGTGAGE